MKETVTSLPMWRPFGRKGHIGGGPSEPGGPFPEPRGGRVPEAVGESCHRRTGHGAGWPIAVAARSEPMREVCVPKIGRTRRRVWRGSAVGGRGGLEPSVRVGTAQEGSGPPSVYRSGGWWLRLRRRRPRGVHERRRPGSPASRTPGAAHRPP